MTKKKAAAKKAAATRKKMGVQAQAMEKCFENAQRSAQPGIIGTIMQILIKAKETKHPYKVDEILDHLQKRFPDRQREKMAITVRAQLQRLPSQKGFAINKMRDGRTMRYEAG